MTFSVDRTIHRKIVKEITAVFGPRYFRGKRGSIFHWEHMWIKNKKFMSLFYDRLASQQWTLEIFPDYDDFAKDIYLTSNSLEDLKIKITVERLEKGF